MDEEEQERLRAEKSAILRQRDAARKRERRKRAREEKERLALLEHEQHQAAAVLQAAQPDLGVDPGVDIDKARATVKEILEASQKEAQALILSAQEIAAAQAREVALQVENSAKEKARALERAAENWVRTTKDKCLAYVKKALEPVNNTIPDGVREDPQMLEEFLDGLPNPVVLEDAEEARRKRRREDDSRRQRKCYERRKAIKESESLPITRDALHPNDQSIGCSKGASSSSSARFVAKRLIDVFEIRTQKSSDEFKTSVWSRIWRNPRVERFLPKAFSNAKEARAVIGCFENIQGAIQSTRKAARKDHLAAKHTLLSGMINSSTIANREGSTLCKLLRIKKQSLLAAADRRDALDGDKDMSWPLGARKTKSGRRLISEEVKQVVVDWWTSESRVLPGRKDVIRHRLARKLYDIHIIQILDETQAEFYGRFVERHPDVLIGQRAFEKLKPYFVRVLKDRYVCCCQQHVQMDYVKDALNAMRVKLHRSEMCTCQCVELCVDPNPLDAGFTPRCKAHLFSFESVTDLWESCVCPKEEGKAWHRLKCLKGECSDCGIQKLAFCPSEIDSAIDSEVLWRVFEKVEVYPNKKTPRGREVKDSKRIKLVHKRTHPLELVNFVKQKLPLYIMHNFRAKWQTRAYQECLKSFPPGVVVSVIDFAENYSFQIQNEIQSMHWHSDQITLLIHITYRHDMNILPRVDPVTNLPVRDIVKNYHVYISDDKEHDSLFVHHCLERHAEWLEKEAVDYYEHWVWSDGAASQFKCARNFYYIARHHLIHGRAMRWFFFGSGHGKGEHDGAGGVIKRALRFEQLRTDSVKLQNASDACNFLHQKFSISQSGTPRFFWHIDKADVNRQNNWGCKTLKGSRDLHVFIGVNPRSATTMKTRKLACMCVPCVEGDDEGCESTDWCGPWFTEQLEPNTAASEIESLMERSVTRSMSTVGEEVEVGPEGVNENVDEEDGPEEIELTLLERAALIERGDNFAVKAEQPNEEDAIFYLLKCDEPVSALKVERGEYWSSRKFKVGDVVITGKYYKQVKKGDSERWLLLDNKPSAVHFAKSVVYVNFEMTPYKGKGRRFKIQREIIDVILTSIEDEETGSDSDGD